MEAYYGRIEDGRIVTEGMPPIPDGYRVVVTLLEAVPQEEIISRKLKALDEFMEGLEQCDEPLSPEFDEIISQRLNFTRELELCD